MSKFLSEIAHIYNGADYKKNAPGGTVPIYGTGGLMGFTSIPLYNGPAVLSGRKGSINNPIFVEGEFWNVDTIFCIKANAGIDTKWLFYNFLNTDLTILNEATGVPSVNSKALYKLKFKWFELPIQQHISHILTIADIVIEKTQSTISKYKVIKQGMLQDLFTRGIDVTTGKLRPKYEDAPELYKESKLGIMPRGWEMETLDRLTEKIGSGITPTGGSEIYKSSGVLFIRSQNVLIGRLAIEDAAFITKEIDERMEGSRVKPFDVLLNITGASIGRCAFFPSELESANVNQHVCIIRFLHTSKPLAVFASEFMNSDFGQCQINRSNAGGNRDGLNFQQIKSFNFPVIDEIELELISTIIETISEKINIEVIFQNKLQMIKVGLMEDLLGGKRSVKINQT